MNKNTGRIKQAMVAMRKAFLLFLIASLIAPPSYATYIPMTVEEQDGTPSVNLVKKIKVDNDTLTDNSNGIISIGSSGANTALSNLASVAINTALIPGSAAGPDLRLC